MGLESISTIFCILRCPILKAFRLRCYKHHLKSPFYRQTHSFYRPLRLVQSQNMRFTQATGLFTWGHRLEDVQSHNGRVYLLREQGRPQGLAAEGDHRDICSTVPQLLWPLCVSCSWVTDCRAVNQECVKGNPEGKKGSSSTNLCNVSWQ